jgi:predicted GH43/DUF377 family glycosyl hydrolase
LHISLKYDLREIKREINSIDKAINESWWKKLVEGDAKESKHYEKTLIFIVSVNKSMYARLNVITSPDGDYDRY